MKVKIFADGADLSTIQRLAADHRIQGWTTNPSLMKAAGVKDYRTFAMNALVLIGDRPISLEVFADDFPTMESQAREIASWGKNIYVKIPVSDTKGHPSSPLVRRLSRDGVKVNVTAVMTSEQVSAVVNALDESTPAIISVFAGRLADIGCDPIPLMRSSRAILEGKRPNAELLWASPREVLNVKQAEKFAHIITISEDLLKKMALFGKSAADYSRETVQMFHRDAVAAGYRL